MRRFEGKTAVITGGGSGIGAATARRFAEEGCAVLILDISGRRAASVRDEIVAGGGRALSIKGDASEESTIESAVSIAVNDFGRLDIMFNNAGLACPGPIDELTAENWARVLAVTLSSTFFGLKHAIRVMRRQGAGTIINNGSVDGLMAEAGMAAYCAAKAGVVNLTRVCALETARDGIRVNCVCPGSVNTRISKVLASEDEGRFREEMSGAQPMGRQAEPEEIANIVAFLASDEASYMTGAILVADGGLTAHNGLPGFLAERPR